MNPPMKLACLIFFAILGVGCQNITQDDFGIEYSEHAELETEYGTLSVSLHFQDTSIRRAYSAQQILDEVHRTFQAYEQVFGEVPTGILSFTIVIIRNNSSQWENVCWDRPNDLVWIDGCSNDVLFPDAALNTADWEVAVNSDVYAQGYDDRGIYIHEALHGILFFDGRSWFYHDEPDVWEGESGSAYNLAFNR